MRERLAVRSVFLALVLLGLAEGCVRAAVDLAQALDGRNLGPKIQLSDLLVLSIGTGRVPTYIDGSNLDWGLAKWAPYLMDLLQDGTVDVPHFQCEQVLGERYYRVQPVPPRKVELDDPGEVAFLEQIAGSEEVRAMVAQAAGWVERWDT